MKEKVGTVPLKAVFRTILSLIGEFREHIPCVTPEHASYWILKIRLAGSLQSIE